MNDPDLLITGELTIARYGHNVGLSFERPIPIGRAIQFLCANVDEMKWNEMHETQQAP